MKVVDEKTNGVTLSHSSANLLRGCEQKYVYYKVRGEDKDPDAEQNEDQFNIGKAVHFILEEMLHVWNEKEFFELLPRAVQHFEVPEYEHLIAALAFKGFQCQKKSGLTAVHCEYKIQTDVVLGYVDLIARDEKGWWIIDFKTAARASDLTNTKLEKDYQLNLYAYHVDMIARDLQLDPEEFLGCRYRVVTKTKAKARAGESVDQYIKRVIGKEWVQGFDVVIPADSLSPKEIYKGHKELLKRAKKLYKDGVPKRNYGHCSSFFRPCEYWSKCHGDTYTNKITETVIEGY